MPSSSLALAVCWLRGHVTRIRRPGTYRHMAHQREDGVQTESAPGLGDSHGIESIQEALASARRDDTTAETLESGVVLVLAQVDDGLGINDELKRLALNASQQSIPTHGHCDREHDKTAKRDGCFQFQ